MQQETAPWLSGGSWGLSGTRDNLLFVGAGYSEDKDGCQFLAKNLEAPGPEHASHCGVLPPLPEEALQRKEAAVISLREEETSQPM